MEELTRLEQELEKWNTAYEEAVDDYEDAEERMEEAESICHKLEAQIKTLKEKRESELKKIIFSQISSTLDYHTALMKAFLFTSKIPQKNYLDYIIITDKEVIGTDAHRFYIAKVDVPENRKNSLLKFQNISDLINQKNPITSNIENHKYLKTIFHIAGEIGQENKISGSKYFFASKISKDDAENQTCFLVEPFLDSAFNQNFLDDALIVMDNNEWSFKQKDEIAPLLITNEQETIGILPCRRC